MSDDWNHFAIWARAEITRLRTALAESQEREKALQAHKRAQAEDIMTLGRLVYDDKCVTWKDRATAAEEREKRLREALTKIAKWFGEFTETGDCWQDGTPISYGAQFGSNGERDFMRSIASAALEGAT